MSEEVSDSDDTEGRHRVCQSIMEDICNELFGLGGSGDQANADSTAGASSSGQQQTNDEFFKTLS